MLRVLCLIVLSMTCDARLAPTDDGRPVRTESLLASSTASTATNLQHLRSLAQSLASPAAPPPASDLLQPGTLQWTMTLHNNCTTNVTLGIAYILNNAIDAPGGQQCQSKYNVVDPPATFCAEYPYQLAPDQYAYVGSYPSMGTVALLTAYTTAGDPVVPAAVLNTTCLNADALECLCGAPSCLRWYLVDVYKVPSFLDLKCNVTPPDPGYGYGYGYGGGGGGGSQDGGSNSSSGGGSTAAIVGAVVGGVVGAAVLAVVAYLLWRKRRAAHRLNHHTYGCDGTKADGNATGDGGMAGTAGLHAAPSDLETQGKAAALQSPGSGAGAAALAASAGAPAGLGYPGRDGGGGGGGGGSFGIKGGGSLMGDSALGANPASCRSLAGSGSMLPDGASSFESNGSGATAAVLAQDPILEYIRSQARGQMHSCAFCTLAGYEPIFASISRSKAAGSMPRQHAAHTSSSSTTATAAVTSSTSAGSGGTRAVDANHWLLGFEEITVVRAIGEGSFGRVYLAMWNQVPVAVKILIDREAAHRAAAEGDPEAAAAAMSALSEPLLAKLDEEAGMLAALRHPNIVNFLGVCHQPPCILTEYCSRGSLAEVLFKARQRPRVAAALTWPRRLAMALDAACGMLHLHSRPVPIVHRDLKSPNLLVDENWRVKVADFNLSRLIQSSSRSSSMAAMNPRWLAPEVLRGEHATQAADVFAFGVVMWELLTWELPWTDAEVTPWQLVRQLSAGARLQLPPRAVLPGGNAGAFAGLDQYELLMQQCWAEAASERPPFSEVVSRLRLLLDCALAD
ncbi:hypothetical protein D9Q98_010312 [Chlorella vulgaris]|uniref:Protein kinase domain-containing protein n=1 Tax=Chlorella vulgaris TaxID=3077 RepID=A0A9D4YUU4_CHLVU|nr:hypothetical protein D9Q98_010312 [Chlorella vulgaris]